MVLSSPTELPMVVVTRPAGENEAWLAALRDAGFPTLALPLIHIAPLATLSDGLISEALHKQPMLSALMFVSVNAVRYFFANLTPVQRDTWLKSWGRGAGPRCWATGAGTRRALLAESVPASAIDWPGEDAPRYDSEQLWAEVAPQITATSGVLIVRGQSGNASAGSQGEGRDWLGRQIVSVGATVDYLSVYQREVPRWDAMFENAWRLAMADANAIWLISSSQALQHARMLMGDDYHRLWDRRLICTHNRIADSARTAGWQRVSVSRPVMDEVIEALHRF
jgi:uroporphyrinogen-III synthase